MPKYVEVLPDEYWWKVKGKLVPNSRLDDPKFAKRFGNSYPYPAVIGLTSNPFGGATYFRSTYDHWELVHKYNSFAAMSALRRLGAGLWNATGNSKIYNKFGKNMPRNYNLLPDAPQAQGIACVGAVLEVIGENRKAVKVKTIKDAGFIEGWGPDVFPELWFRFTSIDQHGNIGYAPAGIPCMIPVVTRQGHGWLPKEAVKFVSKPKVWDLDIGKPKPEPEPPQPPADCDCEAEKDQAYRNGCNDTLRSVMEVCQNMLDE